jgi:hypothetical protein
MFGSLKMTGALRAKAFKAHQVRGRWVLSRAWHEPLAGRGGRRVHAVYVRTRCYPGGVHDAPLSGALEEGGQHRSGGTERDGVHGKEVQRDADETQSTEGVEAKGGARGWELPDPRTEGESFQEQRRGEEKRAHDEAQQRMAARVRPHSDLCSSFVVSRFCCRRTVRGEGGRTRAACMLTYTRASWWGACVVTERAKGLGIPGFAVADAPSETHPLHHHAAQLSR